MHTLPLALPPLQVLEHPHPHQLALLLLLHRHLLQQPPALLLL
jgi:hypothetical protein